MKVMCIITDGFEELEAIGTIALLRRAGVECDAFAVDAKEATGRFDLTLSHVADLKECNVDAYDMLFIPGGPHYEALEKNTMVMDIIKSFFDQNKLVSAICAGPTILGRAGYLKGRNYTCFTAMNEDFQGTYVDQYVVCDQNLITGRSAAAVIDFAFAIIARVLGEDKAKEVKASIYY